MLLGNCFAVQPLKIFLLPFSCSTSCIKIFYLAVMVTILDGLASHFSSIQKPCILLFERIISLVMFSCKRSHVLNVMLFFLSYTDIVIMF